MQSCTIAGSSIRPSRISSCTSTRWPVSKTSSSGRTPSSCTARAIARNIAGRIDHHVVAAGREVHGAAVERADLRPQLLDVHEALVRADHVRARGVDRQRRARSPPSTRSPPMPAVRLSTTSMSAARTRSTTCRYSSVSRDPRRSPGSRTWMCAIAAPGARRLDRGVGDLLGRDGHALAAIGRRAGAGDRTGDEGFPAHGPRV